MSKSEATTAVDYQILALSLNCLAVYNLPEQSPLFLKLRLFLETMSHDDLSLDKKITAYAAVYKSFALTARRNSWSGQVIELMLTDVNPFTQLAARQKSQARRDRLAGLVPAVLEDLNTLQALASLSSTDIKEDLRRLAIAGGEEKLLSIIGKLPEWPTVTAGTAAAGSSQGSRKFQLPHSIPFLYSHFEQNLKEENAWSDSLRMIADFHQHNGCGDLAFNHMFTWDCGQATPVIGPDPVRLDDLVDYTGLIALARTNTEAFLAGQPAENILFAGDRGTGKSSTVKALANDYHERGLRLIEIRPRSIRFLPDLFKKLSPFSLKFIIFIDDLAFETVNEDYNRLKSLLQGGSSRQPDNVLVYVTTNRRHLVAERQNDSYDDLFESDARQERLSLAERFGLILKFYTPLQKNYLSIVKSLAKKKGLRADGAAWSELADRALTFAARQASRSPRTAEQFIRRELGRQDQSEVAETGSRSGSKPVG